MGALSRSKGACAERELAQAIFDEVGVRLVRNLEQSRCGGYDLTLAPGETGPAALALARYAIEIKRRAQATPANIRAWWRQAESQAEAAGLAPALAYRADRCAWRVVLPLCEIRHDLTRAPGVEFAVELSIAGFAALIREGAPQQHPRDQSGRAQDPTGEGQ